ncbi:hypothetical protein [Pseudofrankia sp. DC12]|uniref:hypothetical protein n=1 Tax=Pseudofrankia sp. DC12 TaxID=683315 RepID=UPI0005F7F027|nr:hypothetical protein [Pseudofrankia sp. DC12]
MTGQTTDGAQGSPTWREPAERLVVLAPGSGPPPGPAAPPPPAVVPSAAPPPPGAVASTGPASPPPAAIASAGARPAYAPPPPPTRPLTALEDLRQRVPVRQECAPRLALVESSASDVPRIEALPYVVGVYQAAPPAEVLATLGDLEVLFVHAWLARFDDAAHHGDDDRPGQGLPWDAPGYEPPDAATG